MTDREAKGLRASFIPNAHLPEWVHVAVARIKAGEIAESFCGEYVVRRHRFVASDPGRIEVLRLVATEDLPAEEGSAP